VNKENLGVDICNLTWYYDGVVKTKNIHRHLPLLSERKISLLAVLS